MADVIWSSIAIGALIALSSRDLRQARRIERAIDALAMRRQGDIKKLRGEDDTWRLRVGDWRVIYKQPSANQGLLYVQDIRLRRDAYDD